MMDGLLGEFVTLKRGYDLPNGDRRDGDVPVISSSGPTGTHNEAKVDGPGVVTGRYGTLGEIFYCESAYWPLNTSLYVMDFKGNHPKFIYYFLHTLGLGQRNAAGAVPGVNRNVLHKMAVRVPEVAVQRRIADVLSAYDNLIDNNRRRMVLLEESIHLLYREWFVSLRFPGHDLIDTTATLPTGWEYVSLSAVAGVNTETLSLKDAPAEIRYVAINDVSTGQIDAYRSLAFSDAPSRARRVVRDGDIIWATVRPGNRAFAVIKDPPANLVVSTGFAVLRPVAVGTAFLYAATTHEEFVAHMTAIAQGAAYPAVNARDFEDYILLRPTEALLGKFEEVAAPALDTIHTLRQQNQKLREARDLLLPRLMDGRIPV